MTIPFFRPISRVLLGVALASVAGAAQAEVKEVRFARQLGLGYLQLYVMQEQKLLEKHSAALGLGEVKGTYLPLGGPAPINDALLSGVADFGAAGVPPFILIWDKTRPNYKVKALSALNSQPSFLNTISPKIKSLKDFTESDRIALPSVKVSFQAILLQMASEKVFGAGQHTKLDNLTVSLPHPDGTAALLSGRSEITAHFTSAPFQYQQLRDARVHRVLNSYEITDGHASFSALWTTSNFYQANPKTMQAVLAAVEDANGFIARNRAEAARIFIKIENSKLPQEFVEELLADPDILYTVPPQNIMKFADFMARTGSIGMRPEKWQDMFFPAVHDRPGS
jgi:NitT/TauT family transport system substrate-binding protein